MEINNGQYRGQLEKLRLRARFFMFLAVFFLAVAAVLGAILFAVWEKDDRTPDRRKHPPPYHKEITQMMQGLHYSGTQMLLRPDVRLALDFKKRLWILHNAYDYDQQGRVLLEQGKYGTCGELSAYLADRIRPLLGEGFEIKFARATHSGYFLGDSAEHTVLKVYPARHSGHRQAYVIDPSFKRYGPPSDFEDYFFYEETPQLGFVKRQERALVRSINNGFPLLVRKDYLLGLVIEGVMGEFDRNNFTVALTATRKHRYAGRFVFALRKYAGERQVLENELLAKQILSDKEYRALKNRVIELFENAQEDK